MIGLERIYPMLNEKTAVDIDENFQKIEGVINSVGVEILSSEGIQNAINKWLSDNEFKPKDAVATFSDLPKEAELKEIRGVLDENGVYIYGGEKWIKLYEINFNALETVNKKIDNLSSKSALYDKVYSGQTIYKKPSDFALPLPAQVIVSQKGEVLFNYDVAKNKITPTKTYYVDVKTGRNSNPGTESQPFQSINRALRYGDADNIILKEGVYGWSNSYNAYNQTKSYNLIGIGEVYIGAHRDNLTWTQHSTYGNVYQTNATSVLEVLDIKDDSYRFLEKLSSVEAVSNKVNSYYIDSSNNIYVRTYNDRKPDDYVLPQLSGSAAKFENLDKVYIENIKFTNNVVISGTSNSKKAYVKNVTFSASTSGNAVSVLGADTIFQNCKALYASADGFNYHVNNGILPNAIEIDCYAAHNGRDGANQNNGSTMHDGGKIIRIRGEYHHNHGPNVIDVNDGTQSLNIGVHAHHSTADSDLSNVDFRIRDEGGGSRMWLVNCVAHDSKYSLSVEGGATETVENSLLMNATVRL